LIDIGKLSINGVKYVICFINCLSGFSCAHIYDQVGSRSWNGNDLLGANTLRSLNPWMDTITW